MSSDNNLPLLLLVDDDLVYLESLRLILGKLDNEFRFVTASSVKDAIAILRTESPSLAVLDLNLPDGTAADVLGEVVNTPCILSTQGDPSTVFNIIMNNPLMAANIVGFVSKPISPLFVWEIRTGLRIGRERMERNQLVAQATAKYEERRAILAKHLHDELGAGLTQMTWLFTGIGKMIRNDAEVRSPIREQLLSIAVQGADVVKKTHIQVSNIISRLRPELLTVAGLRGGLEHMIGEWRDSAVDVQFTLDLCPEVDLIKADKAASVFRIVQEAVTNAMRHADPVELQVLIEHVDGRISISVRSVGKIESDRGHYALTSLRERAASLGGLLSFAVDTTEGTSHLRVEIPNFFA